MRDSETGVNYLVQYVKDENNTPFGCVVAVEGINGPQLGWSQCHPKDHFNKQLGQKIALGRAKKNIISPVTDNKIFEFQNVYIKVEKRAHKYFKKLDLFII